MRRVVAAVAAAVVVVILPAPAVASNDPYRDVQYGLDRMGVELAWTRSRGAGVAIAIIDTGVDLQHEDLRDRVVAGRDFVDGDDLPQDENGHGTHVAGVAAAAADNGRGVAGVAPGAQIIPLRVLDRNGTGTESNVVKAIRFAVQQSKSMGLRLVVNLSLTDLKVMETVESSRAIQDAIREAWFAGAVIVAAAGNENIETTDYPAAGPNVLSVGATDEQDRRASFSNRGPLVVAPGDRIVSTYYDPAEPGQHDVYASGSGTSMAAPHVAGVAAMLLSAGMTNEETVDRIVRTSDDLGAPGRDPEFGFGRVNAAQAAGVSADATVGSRVPSNVPVTAPNEFEQILAPTPAPDVQAAGPADGQPPASARQRTPLLALAGTLLVIAYVGLVWSARAEVRSPPTGAPWGF